MFDFLKKKKKETVEIIDRFDDFRNKNHYEWFPASITIPAEETMPVEEEDSILMPTANKAYKVLNQQEKQMPLLEYQNLNWMDLRCTVFYDKGNIVCWVYSLENFFFLSQKREMVKTTQKRKIKKEPLRKVVAEKSNEIIAFLKESNEKILIEGEVPNGVIISSKSMKENNNHYLCST